MLMKRRRPGSPKGQPKPAKRAVDAGFPGRLQEAIDDIPGMSVPLLSKKAGCTRAVLRKYLNGGAKTVEALLLFAVADALKISARWLLTSRGLKAREAVITPDQARVLDIIDQLVENTSSANKLKSQITTS